MICRILAPLALFALAAGHASTAYAQNAGEYVVKEGETLGGIANRTGVSQRAIIDANGLKEPYNIRIGQKLKIPRVASAAATSRSSSSTSSTHIVEEGETLGGIANRKGVTRQSIIDANGLKEPYHIRIGQKLTIPAQGGASSSRPAASSTASASRASNIYVVKDGETLGGIANRAGVTQRAIIDANKLKEPYHLRTGQQLVIPGARTHIVKEGDTGFGLAYEYGVPFKAIAEANGLNEDASLRIGQRLTIPPAGRTSGTASAPATSATPAAAPARPVATSRFRWPVRGPVRAGFNSDKGGQGHNGIDIGASEGTAVQAAADGIVIYAQYEKHRFGNLIILDHGNRWHTAYGHLSRLSVKKGETVKAGAQIGLVGATGLTDASELHFEIRHQNQPLDPRAVLGSQP